MTAPIKRISLQSEIIKYIQSYIEEQGLKEGDRLPSQGEFIEMMQVSRTALREAFKTLEADKIVEVKNGKGIYVGPGEQEKQSVEALLGFTLEKEKLLEVLEARRAMENELIHMIIRTATEEELDDLGKSLDALMEKLDSGEPDTAEDRAFHDKIYKMCHNEVFYKLLLLLSEYTDRFWQFPLDMKEPFKESMPYHGQLYFALRERNEKKAQRINRKLLDCIYQDIVRQLRKD